MGGGKSVPVKKQAHAGDDISVQWKFLPSVDEAKGNYKKDGTLLKSTDPGHLELRTLLDEPLAQREIGNFAKSIHCPEAFMCWVDLQEFKGIPEGAKQFRKSKAVHIYHKYIKPGATLEFGGLEQEEREDYAKLIEACAENIDLITNDCFDKVLYI
jgi:hypothetical protein